MITTTGIYLSDKDRILKMSAGTIENGDTPKRIQARSPIDWETHDYSFSSRDDAHAWQIAGTAQRSAAYAGYNPALLGIEAYVLRTNGERREPDQFDPAYFWAYPPDTTRRLTVLSLNRNVDSQPLDHGLVEKLQPVDPASYRALPDDIIRSAWGFLDDVLQAYQKRGEFDDDPVLEAITRTGHPFTYSTGFLEGYSAQGGPGNNGDGGPSGDSGGHLGGGGMYRG